MFTPTAPWLEAELRKYNKQIFCVREESWAAYALYFDQGKLKTVSIKSGLNEANSAALVRRRVSAI